MKKILPFITLVVLFAFTNIASSAQCGGVCSGLTTYTQGGWGSAPHGGNPGTILANNFAAVYPSGVTIGCNTGYTFRFTSASAVQNFLPQGGSPGAIHASATNPTGSYTVLAGQVLTATINIDFDKYNPSGYKTNNDALLANLTFKEGEFSGKTVQFVLDEANKVLGGCPSSYSASDLNDALTTVNENYDGGSGNNEGELENEDSAPTVASITGTATICKGATTTLSDATAGGVWSTGDATIATVSSGGVVTGVAAGTVTITYSVTNSCGIGSKSISITVNALPSAPTVNITQPTCAVATGTITVTAPTGSGYTYSIDGTNYQSSTTFTGLASGTYSITAKNGSGCVSSSGTSATVNAQPATPAAPTISVTQPTCAVATGTITVTAPTGSGYTYSIDGTNYQSSATFSNVAVGTYSVTAKNASGCVSSVTSATVNAQPSTPAAPTVSVTQTTCAVATGTITVTAPTGSGITYSIDGTNYQSSTTFSNVAVGTYSVTAKNASGCVSSVTSATVNAQPATPSAPTVSITQPSGNTSTGTITVTAPTGAGYTYSIDGTNYQSSATFSNVAVGTYTVTAMNATGCSATSSATINSHTPCDTVCSGFTTFTQGGWGAAPHGGNAGTILANNFAAVYPSGVTIGCNTGYTFKFTSAAAIQNFLPQGGTPGAINASATNPTGSYTVLAGQVLAATLNVDFDKYNPSGYKTNDSSLLSTLTFNSGVFSGKTVQFVLDEANKVLGGCSSSYSASDLNDALTTVNENYDNGGGTNEGNLNCGGLCGEVGGGDGGGLESKSLGDAVAKRVYNRAINNEQAPVNYSIMQPLTVSNVTTFGTGGALTLSSILPKLLSVNSQNLVSYISTPTDIPSITNATDVLSIDYTLNNQAKAVSFGTQTSGEVYDHTKAICDRLKGSTLIDMKNVVVKNMNMVAYTLKDANGNTEYAMSFVIGAKSGRNNYTIQSNWLNKDYIPDETMYNIQLWAVSPDMVTNMASQIISNLQANSQVQFLDDHTVLPSTYIASGNRITSNLTLTVNNNTSATTGYFVMDDQTTELSTGTAQRTVPFTIQPNGKTNISIPMSDNYASTVSMYMNNKLQDVVYMADGTWSYAAGPSSTVNNFKVTNDAIKTYSSDELPVFRNVEINGNSSDFVSIFKLLKGGGIAQDVSGYKTLKFTASGGYNLRVTLVKNSIANWADQYNTLIPLDNGTKDYSLPLSSFKSASIKDNINANDVTTVVFSIEVGNGRSNTLNTTLSNISFSKQDVAYLQSLSAKEVQVYPNPVIGNNFTCSFMSDKQTSLNLRVIDVESGRVVTTQQVNAVAGQNTVQVNINRVSSGSVYMVALDNNEVQYKKIKVISGSR